MSAAREEAVERVRALAEGAMQPHEWGYRDPVVGGFVEDRTPFDLADRALALLSALELGSVASLPVKAVDEPAKPLGAVSAEVLAQELEAFAKAEGAFYDNQNYGTLTALERARVSCRERLSAYKAARP